MGREELAVMCRNVYDNSKRRQGKVAYGKEGR